VELWDTRYRGFGLLQSMKEASMPLQQNLRIRRYDMDFGMAIHLYMPCTTIALKSKKGYSVSLFH